MTESIQPPPLSPPDPSPAPAALSGPSLVERVDAVRDAVGRAFIGQPEVLDQILIALLAGGHVLIEGVPGLGKTLLVRALAQALELDYGRFVAMEPLTNGAPATAQEHVLINPDVEQQDTEEAR